MKTGSRILLVQSSGILPRAAVKLHRDVNHSTLLFSSAINISGTIPVGPAALPFFIILRAFRISSPNQFRGSLYIFTGCGIIPCVLLIQQFFHILSPFFLHLIIFYQHFSICICHTICSYYILPGFCHLLCNPVDILLSCCTLQLINKLLPCLFLCKSNTSCISSCLFILIPITCFFWFMPYLIASSFLLNSFSYLIIPPPPPTPLLLLLLLYGC